MARKKRKTQTSSAYPPGLHPDDGKKRTMVSINMPLHAFAVLNCGGIVQLNEFSLKSYNQLLSKSLFFWEIPAMLQQKYRDMACYLHAQATENKTGFDGQTNKHAITAVHGSTLHVTDHDMKEILNIAKEGIGVDKNSETSGCVAGHLCLPAPTIMHYWCTKIQLPFDMSQQHTLISSESQEKVANYLLTGMPTEFVTTFTQLWNSVGLLAADWQKQTLTN